MTHAHELPPNAEYTGPDYRQKLADVLDARPDGLVIPPEYLHAMTIGLETGYRRFGDSTKDSYREFHNDVHFFNVATGSWRVLDFMKDEMQRDIQDNDYIVGGLIGVLHDVVHEKSQKDGTVAAGDYTVDFGEFAVTVTSDGTKTNEQLSAEVAVLFLQQLKLPKEIHERVYKGILLTEVSFEDGIAVQKHAGKGGRDYGVVAAAIADTEGIFNGEEWLTKDAARLIMELLGEKITDEGLVTAHIKKFTEIEAPFVRQKLAEFILHIIGTADSPEEQQTLTEKLQKHFAPYEKRALAAAAFFDSTMSNVHDIERTIREHILHMHNLRLHRNHHKQ